MTVDRSLRNRDRTRARAWALQIHYRWESGGRTGTLMEVLAFVLETEYVAEARRSYLRRLVETMDAHLDAIDGALRECLENWRMGRLAAIDRGVLRIAAAELLYLDDIPPKVSLKESVRLAERYGSDESSAFVNGVLDALADRSGAEAR